MKKSMEIIPSRMVHRQGTRFVFE